MARKAITDEIAMGSRERAQELFDLLMEGNLRQETRDRIRIWFAEPEHRADKDAAMEASFDRLVSEEAPDSRAYSKFRQLSVLMGIDDADLGEKSLPVVVKRPVKSFILRRTWISVAAVILPLLVIAGFFTFRYMETRNRMIEVAVGAEDQIPVRVELPDGSQVWLNSSSSLSYPESFSRKRRVNLDGEAYFDVKKSNDRPFVVNTEHMDVTVLGTEFNLKSHSEDEHVELYLLSGNVNVKADDESVSLRPLQHLVFNVTSGHIAVEEFDPDDLDDWRKTEILFKNTPLNKILRRVASHYGVEIETGTNVDTSVLIRMVFDKTGDLEDALFALQMASGDSFGYHVAGEKVVITKK